MLAYFHSPVLVLMTANLGFFVLTAKNLLQTEKDTRLAGRQKKGTERYLNVPYLFQSVFMNKVYVKTKYDNSRGRSENRRY